MPAHARTSLSPHSCSSPLGTAEFFQQQQPAFFRIGRVHVCSRFLNCSICILRPCLLPHRLAPELLPSPCVGSSMPIFSCGDQCRLMAAHVALLNPRCDSCSLCGACLKRPAAIFRDTWATDSDKSPEKLKENTARIPE